MRWVAILVTLCLVTSKLAHLARRCSIVLVAGGLVLAAAGPAGADTPEFWSDPDSVNPWDAALLVIIPVVLFVVITAIVMLPGYVKGERLNQGGQPPADQWFGGPSSGTAELPAPDTEQSQAGGASGRW